MQHRRVVALMNEHALAGWLAGWLQIWFQELPGHSLTHSGAVDPFPEPVVDNVIYF